VYVEYLGYYYQKWKATGLGKYGWFN